MLSATFRNEARGATSTAGFTLMELIVVMTIIALITAAVVPIYSGSLSWAQRDRATRDFVATLKYAQERAITDVTDYRFYFDRKKNTYWVMRLDAVDDRNKTFAMLDEGLAGVAVLPEGIEVRQSNARFDEDKEANYVGFYANGACDYVKLTLEQNDDRRVTIETKGRLGQFEVKEKK